MAAARVDCAQENRMELVEGVEEASKAGGGDITGARQLHGRGEARGNEAAEKVGLSPQRLFSFH